MKIYSNITHLVRKLFSGRISDSELDELNGWYDSIQEEEELTVYTDKYESKEQIKSRMLSRLRNEINSNKEANKNPINRFRSDGGMVATIAAILIIALTLFVNILNKNLKESRLASTETLYLERANPNGQKSKIILTDGTIVWLNAASKIRFPEKFNANERKIFLEGEAFFSVTRDENRPFIIQTENAVTTVLGTSFNIKSYQKESVSITVKSGKVKVNTENIHSGLNDELTLIENEQITFTPQSGEITKKIVDANEFLSWKDDVIRFEHTKLSEVIKTLERWYDKKIVLENDDLNDCVLVAEYKNERFFNVLESLKFSLGIDYTIQEDKIIISGKGCSNTN